MEVGCYTWSQVIEQRLQLYAACNLNASLFNNRFVIGPLSSFIVNNSPRYHKLELFIMAATLLRFSDANKLHLYNWVNGTTQEIKQGKTKEIVSIPPLFLSVVPSTVSSFPAITSFTDSYDKLRYTLKKLIPFEIREHMTTQRNVTHIFRFLRTCFLYLQNKDFYLASKYLGHKDPESVRSYLPPELLNFYSHFLSKG